MPEDKVLQEIRNGLLWLIYESLRPKVFFSSGDTDRDIKSYRKQEEMSKDRALKIMQTGSEY